VILRFNMMLTTSIAYGQFDYSQRNEFVGIDKNLLMGNPYLQAYLEQSSGKPKLAPGECRLIHSGLPQDTLPLPDGDPFSLRLHPFKGRFSYFSWMSETPEDYERFRRDFGDAYNLKYSGMLSALQRSARVQPLQQI
jgi:hypothetical protein